jgi:sugar phosphate isomerase/epimerase
MLQIRLGIELASLRLPLKKALLTARELGVEAVEIDLRNELRPEDLSRTGVRQIRKMLDDLNLRISAARFPTRSGYAALDGLEARIDATKRAMLSAYELGTNVVINQIGRVPAETDSAATSNLVQALADLGRHGQKVGALLAAETGTESGADLANLIARLPPGSIGVDLNPANLIINGHSPRDAAEALAPHILHIHATDAKATPNSPSSSPSSKSNNTAATSPSRGTTARIPSPTSARRSSSCEIYRSAISS